MTNLLFVNKNTNRRRCIKPKFTFKSKTSRFDQAATQRYKQGLSQLIQEVGRV